jgi:hypothetical protein
MSALSLLAVIVQEEEMTNLTTKWLDSRNINYTISAAGLIYVDGDIDIAAGESVALDGVAEVSGHVSVRGGASLTAAALAKCGYVDVWEGASLTLDALAKSGDVSVRKGASLTAAALAECGNVSVWEGASLTAPALAKCGYVDVWEGASLTLDALAECGNVYVWEGASLTAPALAKCGNVYVREGASLTAPALAECGNVSVRKGASLTANALAECGMTMQCIKTGSHIYLAQYAEFAYGDAYEGPNGLHVFRIVQRSFEPLRDVRHFTVYQISEWFDKDSGQTSTLIAFDVANHGYEGMQEKNHERT